MTSGTSTGGSWPNSSAWDGQIGFVKTWSGSNGKYIPSSGLIKYNDFSCTIIAYGPRITGTKETWSYDGYGNLYLSAVTSIRPDVSVLQANTWDANDDLALLGRLADKIRGHDFSASISLADVDKTAQMVQGSLKSLVKAVTCLRKKDLSGLLRALPNMLGAAERRGAQRALSLGDISQAWLAIQYGWKPLLSDIFSAMKATEAITAPPRTVVFRSRYRKKPLFYSSSTSPSNWIGKGVTDTTGQYIYRLTEGLSTARSLGLLDPASLLWERLPFSFIVDWALPIGSYLSALNVFPFLSGDWVKTVVETRDSRFNGLAWSVMEKVDIPKGFYIQYGGFDSYRRKTISRTTGTGALAIPLPVFKKNIRDVFTDLHLANTIALIHQFGPDFLKGSGKYAPSR